MTEVIKRGIAPFVVVGFVVGAIGVFYGALRSLDFLSVHYGFALLAGYDFSSMIVLPVGIVGVNGAVLIFEAVSIGWERSALKRLLFLETSTVRTDLFYLVLRLSGLMYALSFVLSFGSVFVLARMLGEALQFDVLSGVSNLGLHAIVVILVNSFVFYWAHRLMHTRALFEVHKVHHSALELNVLTPTRNHPIDFLIMILINTIPASILGADPLIVTAYLGINGLYQCTAHSEIPFFENKVCRAIFITPHAHRVHHSNEVQHYDKNFGILTLWDKVFGTYYSPTKAGEFSMGVKNEEDFNTDHPVKELCMVVYRWLAGFRRIFGTERS